ncbi:MAG: hypothetical protein A4E28_00815 [Methanocella sp. PtaU1.Bin125]|nr:MAG: hypothetical protein A4E28_00815 [Methanocella sp. PtaU1.Bin125]
MVARPPVALLRKLIHIGGGLFVPVALLSQYIALALALLGLFLFIILERQKRGAVPELFRHLYRDNERESVAMEPLAYLLAIIALLALSIVFMPGACYVAILVMTVGDGVATLAGKAVGGPGLPGSRKTLAGSLAGLVAAAAAGYFVAGLPVAIAGAAGGMAVEAYAGRYDNALTAVAAFACAALAAAIILQ